MFNTCNCPTCNVKYETVETRNRTVNGATYVSRRKRCPKCGYKITVGEIPLEILQEIVADD